MNRAILPLLCLALLPWLGLDVSASGVPWTWVAPKPQGNELRASAYDAQRDLTVVVGDYGTVMTRTGNSEWQVHQVRAGGRFSCITWTGKVFIAGSESGGLFRSLDGVDWSRIRIGQFSDGPNSPPSSSGGGYYDLNGDQMISALVTGNGITVALAGDSVWVSSDEERRTWQKQKLPNTSSDSWSYYSDVEFGKGLFVAVGLAGSIVTSSNGIAWTKRSSGTRRELDSAAFNGTYFVALDAAWMSRSSGEFNETDAQVVRSVNGTVWETIIPAWPSQAQDPDFALAAGNKFILDGWGLWSSDDFQSWSEISDQFDNWQNYNLHGVGPTSSGRLLIFAEAGEIFSSDTNATSINPEIVDTGLGYGGSVGGLVNLLVGSNNWSALEGETGSFIEQTEPDTFWPDPVFQQKDFLLGLGRNYESTKSFALLERNINSARWLTKGSATIPGKIAALAAASEFGPVVCVSREDIYGDNDEFVSSTYKVYYSQDWSTWEVRDNYVVPQWSPMEIQLEHDGQRFILLAPTGALRISADGRDWTSLTSLPDDTTVFRQRFHGSDNYVPRANRPTAFASNGQRIVVMTQKARTDQEGYTFRLASVDGRFFVHDFQSSASGWREFIAPWASIPDGNWSYSWSEAPPGRSMVWNGTRFIAVPQEKTPIREPQAGRVFASVDGENWTQHEMPAQAVRLAWTGTQFVATSEDGGVLTHPTGLSPEIVSNLRIVSQPSSTEAFNGETIVFEVIAQTDLPGLTYQWFKDGRPISGATKSFLNVKAGPKTTGQYYVRLTAGEGVQEFSAPAFLALRSAASWSWQDGLEGDRVITAAPGGSVQLALTGVQGPPGGITYQWFKDGKAIPGQTRASLSLENISLSSVGVYTAVITTSAGKVTTEMRRLVVEDSSLLVYGIRAASSVRRSVGPATGRENLSGYVIVDRSASQPQVALIWVSRVGGQAVYRTEILEDAVMHSTGPGARTTSVLSHAITTGSYPRQDLLLFWISGPDRLVQISETASTFAPTAMSGWVNSIGHSAAGSTIQTANVSLTLDRALTSTLRLSTLEAAVEDLESRLMERGIYPSSE